MLSFRAWPLSVRAGVVALAVGLALTFWLASTRGWDWFIAYDAVYFRSVAGDLDASDAVAGDSAYRYGRIGLPLLTWILALGQVELLDATQALVTPIFLGVTVGFAVAIAGRVSRHPHRGLVVVVVPGLWIGFSAARADTMLAGLALVAAWATIEGKGRVCVAAIAAATLTKEVGAICALPSALVAYRSGDRRAAVARIFALLPALAWWSWVRLQSGEWPFLADEPARARAIAPPFVDLVGALTGGRGVAAAAQLALLVGVLGVIAVARFPRSALAWHAGAWGVLALCLGDNVVAYAGDTLRVLTPSACVVVLSLLISRRGEAQPDGRSVTGAGERASPARVSSE